MSNKIEGIAVPILTPINEVEEINHEQLAALTDYVTEGGVNAIFVNGTTGEFARFSPEIPPGAGEYRGQSRKGQSGGSGRRQRVRYPSGH